MTTPLSAIIAEPFRPPVRFVPPPIKDRYVRPTEWQEALDTIRRELKCGITRPTFIELPRDEAQALLSHVEDLESQVEILTAKLSAK